jgi:hypothetical protein
MCTSLTRTLHFSLSLCVLPAFLRMFQLFFLQFMGNYANYLTCKLWKTLHFQKWTYVLQIVNTCTSCSHTFVLPFRWFYYVSSTFMWNMHFQNWIFCISLYMIYYFSSILRERCTSEIEHFVLPYIIAYTFRSHSFVLSYITAYTSRSHSFVLPVR